MPKKSSTRTPRRSDTSRTDERPDDCIQVLDSGESIFGTYHGQDERVSFHVSERFPRLPGRISSVADPTLRRRGCDAWRIAHELLQILHVWKHFVFLASQEGSIDESTMNRIARSHPSLVEFKAALESLVELRAGNVRADCGSVGRVIEEMRVEIVRLVKALHLLGVNAPAFEVAIGETVNQFVAVIVMPPIQGRPSLFPDLGSQMTYFHWSTN